MIDWVVLDTDVAIGQVAAAAGTDSGRTRDDPGSEVDRAAREVNVSAAVHLDPGWLPAMATTSLARTDAEEDTATDGWGRNWVPAELDIVAGMVRKVAVHYRVHSEEDALAVGDLEEGVVDHPGQHGRTAAAAADPVVAPVATVGRRVAAAAREVGSYQGFDPVGLEGRATGRESWHPEVEDDTVAGSPSAGDCRDGVVEPIPLAGVHRTTAEAVQEGAAAAVDPIVAAIDPDPDPEVAVAAAVGLDRNC